MSLFSGIVDAEVSLAPWYVRRRGKFTTANPTLRELSFVANYNAQRKAPVDGTIPEEAMHALKHQKQHSHLVILQPLYQENRTEVNLNTICK